MDGLMYHPVKLLKIVLFGLCSVLLSSGQVHAIPPPSHISDMADEEFAKSEGVFGFLSGINRSSVLLGDMWGLRTKLSSYGISLAIIETVENFGNVTGGTQTGYRFDGLTQVIGQLDTQRAFNFYGGLANVSFLNLWGGNLSVANLETLQTASGIVGNPSVRLWELWYDQKLLDQNRLSIRIGQQSLDQEWIVSSNALYFVNTMFGWPMLPSADMPSGGPAYPLSSLGIRFKARPINELTILAGVFNGNPVKNDNGTDPQSQNRHGTSFPLDGGGLFIAELQYSYPAVGSMVKPDEANALGWTYKIGGWYNTNDFADMRVDQDGLSLANPYSSGAPLQHQGNYALYAVADKLIWRHDQYPDRNLSVFARVMGTPLGDRNLISVSVNAGLLMHSPFRNRPFDTVGLGYGLAVVSSSVAQSERDAIQYSGNATPVQSSESFIELTYQYQLKQWIQIQPDLQYVFNPGAGVPLPSSPTSRVQNELVLGIRTNIFF
ncbi:carbohydrate porin [Candidatus Methylospira mobilis]|uniref:Carbohydrate porin n=1 Tax=Candidatus Methylospira mobilis TaxID=1808979 RepID=A0A5Q0BEF0_9GAMM|nr:carbohydrate porin [Candidatus Methylospira mobilis]QFY41512.1 carbohydrate porin [Candidatus Methylospira mobilis]WNV05255.1 carbohydrate porin [Candidatus Methylospira mobilis]